MKKYLGHKTLDSVIFFLDKYTFGVHHTSNYETKVWFVIWL